MVDGVKEDRQAELAALVQVVIDYAVKNTIDVTPRQRHNGRPKNAPIQDVFKVCKKHYLVYLVTFLADSTGTAKETSEEIVHGFESIVYGSG